MNYSKCPICDSYLLKRYITEKFEYKGKQIIIPNYKIFKCLVCNEEYVPTETIQQTEEILKKEFEVK